MSYCIFDPKINKPLHELTRAEAIEAYEWFMSQRNNRLKMLKLYLKEKNIFLNQDMKSLEELHSFFYNEIIKEGIKEYPSSYIFSLCNDIGIYISEMIINKTESVKWNFFKWGKTNIAYHRPVLMGFNTRNRRYSVDIDLILCHYAHRLCHGGKKEENMFSKLVERCISLGNKDDRPM